MAPSESLVVARSRLAAGLGAAGRRMWRRSDLTKTDLVVLDLVTEALHRVGECLRPSPVDKLDLVLEAALPGMQRSAELLRGLATRVGAPAPTMAVLPAPVVGGVFVWNLHANPFVPSGYGPPEEEDCHDDGGHDHAEERVEEGSKEVEVPTNVFCDGCSATPIVGAWYESLSWDDYDLCQLCYDKEDRNSQEWKRMRPLDHPDMNETPLPKENEGHSTECPGFETTVDTDLEDDTCMRAACAAAFARQVSRKRVAKVFVRHITGKGGCDFCGQCTCCQRNPPCHHFLAQVCLFADLHGRLPGVPAHALQLELRKWHGRRADLPG